MKLSLDGIKKTEVSKQGTTENGVAQNSRSVTISILDVEEKVNTKLQYSKKIQRAKAAVIDNGVLSTKGGLTDSHTTTTISISDLFAFVKRLDKIISNNEMHRIEDYIYTMRYKRRGSIINES